MYWKNILSGARTDWIFSHLGITSGIFGNFKVVPKWVKQRQGRFWNNRLKAFFVCQNFIHWRVLIKNVDGNVCCKDYTSEGCRHSSVDLSTSSILPPRILVPSTPSMLLSIYIWFVSCRKDENKQKEAGIGPFKKDYTYFRLFLFSVHFHLFMACIKTVDPKMMPHRLRCYLAQVMNT